MTLLRATLSSIPPQVITVALADRLQAGDGLRPRLMAVFLLLVTLIAALLVMDGRRPIAAMPASDLVALTEAGFSDSVIQAVVREKVIETAAFTVAELIALKKAGMRDDTLEILVRERSFMRRAQPIVYSSSAKPLNLASVPDLIELQRSGMSDDILQAVIMASSSRRGEDYERAWDMLNRLGIDVKLRP